MFVSATTGHPILSLWLWHEEITVGVEENKELVRRFYEESGTGGTST